MNARSARVIGIGNAWRKDDALGLVVGRRIRAGASNIAVELWEGEPIALIDRLADTGTVVIIDAVSTGSPPGTLHRFDTSRTTVPEVLRTQGTHAVSIGATIELARALGRLPARLILYGIEGKDFGSGNGLSTEAANAIEEATRRILAEIEAGVEEGSGS